MCLIKADVALLRRLYHAARPRVILTSSSGDNASPGRCHWIIAQPGWEEVASYSEDWLKRHFPA